MLTDLHFFPAASAAAGRYCRLRAEAIQLTHGSETKAQFDAGCLESARAVQGSESMPAPADFVKAAEARVELLNNV